MASPSPRRRHSPAVYRRRRLVFIVLIALVIAGIWLLIAQPWRGAAADRPASSTVSIPVPTTSTTARPTPTGTVNPPPTPGPTPSATLAPSAAPTPSATPTAVACRGTDVTVEALVDHGTYAAGQNPQLSIKLTNNSAAGCTINVGTSAQVFTITSGNDTWWRSTDCQSQPSDMVVLLSAGQTVTSATPLTWDRTRSSVDSCGSPDRPRAPGGGASYHLAVSIGGVPATQTASFMLY